MKAILTLVASMFIISACKNGWSVAERNDFINTCTQAAAVNMGQAKAKSYCTCMQQKLEAKYPNSQNANKALNAPGAMQTPEMTAMVQGCLNDGNVNTNNNNTGGGILGGVNNNNNNNNMGGTGAWSKEDEDKWMNICATNPNNRELCSCVLQKLEKKYASYDEMNTKGTQEEGQQLGLQCKEEMNGNGLNNNGGMGSAWSADDEQKFMNTCVQNAMNAGADRQTSTDHCNCTLKKIEARYHSYDDANTNMTKQEVDAIEQQCVQERSGNN
jgi:hypothetical protein